MRKTLSTILFLMLLIQAIATAQENQNRKKVARDIGVSFIKVGEPFGTKDTKPGDVYQFQNFKLRYQYFRDLNEAERKRKKESIAQGTDGGSSMLSPFNGFKVETDDTKSIAQFELSILPYARHSFAVGGINYELRNANSMPHRWILNAQK